MKGFIEITDIHGVKRLLNLNTIKYVYVEDNKTKIHCGYYQSEGTAIHKFEIVVNSTYEQFTQIIKEAT